MCLHVSWIISSDGKCKSISVSSVCSSWSLSWIHSCDGRCKLGRSSHFVVHNWRKKWRPTWKNWVTWKAKPYIWTVRKGGWGGGWSNLLKGGGGLPIFISKYITAKFRSLLHASNFCSYFTYAGNELFHCVLLHVPYSIYIFNNDASWLSLNSLHYRWMRICTLWNYLNCGGHAVLV